MTLVAEPLAIAEGREAGEPRGRGHGHGFGFAPGVLETLGAFGDRCTVVRLASLGNERLDVPRWSTLAEAWAEPGSRQAAHWARHPVIEVDASDPPELVLATGTPVVVLGVDIAAVPWQRAVVDGVRAACARVLVVDLATSAVPGYADIATFGHDRDRGSELLSLLCGAGAR